MTFKVAVRNLSKAYGATRAVDGVSFAIAAGEVFGLLGPNGAGKTTTVESLLGLIAPDAGEIEVCGLDARRRPAAAKARIGAALQSTGLQDKITPREALSLFAALYGVRADVAGLIERFGLGAKADAAFETLSGGQRQRVALALAFVNDPQVVVLDEPTASLDPQMRRELQQHIRAMRGDGKAVLLTTHDMDEAQALCDRIGVMSAGRIVAEGTPAELVARSSARTTLEAAVIELTGSDWRE
jgi:ABC-2 type transport system ATP-binding protein